MKKVNRMYKKRGALHPEILWGRGFGNMVRSITDMEKRSGVVLNSSAHLGALTVEIERSQGLPTPQYSESGAVAAWAVKAWASSGKPIWRLSDDLTKALAFSTVPDENFPWSPKEALPLNGLYVSVPKKFRIETTTDGSFLIEGMYFVEDMAKRCSESPAIPSVTVVLIGEDRAKGTWLQSEEVHGKLCRDDLLLYYPLIEGMNAMGCNSDLYPGQEVLSRLAFNFLWLWHNFRSSIAQEVFGDYLPRKALSKRGAQREKERDTAKGKSSRGYVYLDLNKSKAKEAKRKEPGGGTLKHPVIVPGHIHNYWGGPLKEDGEVIPREDWEKKRKLTPKWVLPYRKGPPGDIRQKDVIIRW